MQYFDVEAKIWKPLASLAPATELTSCHSASSVSSKLFVAGNVTSAGYCVYCYDMTTNAWQTHEDPHSCGVINNLCTLGDYLYAICSDVNLVPQRYNLAKCQWQCYAKVDITSDFSNNCVSNSGATALRSKVYVLYGTKYKQTTLSRGSSWHVKNAVLHCFDPERNVWEEKTSTCQLHFGSSLVVVNNKIYVVGGSVDVYVINEVPCGNPAPVEVYDEENNKWSVVDQKHIPPNNLGAVEIEGRVYFIINKFPVDSGIRIPPGEVYPVHLGDWKNLGNVSRNAVLCYMSVIRENLKTE